MIYSIPQLTLLERITKLRPQISKQITKEDSLTAFDQAIDELRALFVDLDNLYKHDCNEVLKQLGGISDKDYASLFISKIPMLCANFFERIDAIKSTYSPVILSWEELYVRSFNLMVVFDKISADNPFLKEGKLLLNSLIKKLVIPNLDSFFQKHILPNYHYTFDENGQETSFINISDYGNVNIVLILDKTIMSIVPLLDTQPEQIITRFEKRVAEVNSLLLLSEQIKNKMKVFLVDEANTRKGQNIGAYTKLLKLIIKVRTQLATLNTELVQLKKEISPKRKNKKSNGKKSKNQKKKIFKNFKQNKNNHPNLIDVSSSDKLDSDINTDDDDTNKKVEILGQSLSEISVNESSPFGFKYRKSPRWFFNSRS